MASGWAREGAVQEQIESTIKDGVERARNEMNHATESLTVNGAMPKYLNFADKQ